MTSGDCLSLVQGCRLSEAVSMHRLMIVTSHCGANGLYGSNITADAHNWDEHMWVCRTSLNSNCLVQMFACGSTISMRPLRIASSLQAQHRSILSIT
jgi:hypothetical protein